MGALLGVWAPAPDMSVPAGGDDIFPARQKKGGV